MPRPKNIARERTAARAAALLIPVVTLGRPRNLPWGFYSHDSAETGREEIGSIDRLIRQQIEQAGFQQAFQLLQTVPSIQQDAAASILAEMGSDMEAFLSAAHLSCWAAVGRSILIFGTTI